jgi:hypothetical protein
VIKGVAKKAPGTQVSRYTEAGKFLPGAGTKRGLVPPPMPTHAERARRMLRGSPELAQRIQAGMGGEIRSAEGTLAMALRGAGGRPQQAIQRAEEIGRLNLQEAAKVREANRMAEEAWKSSRGPLGLRSAPRPGGVKPLGAATAVASPQAFRGPPVAPTQPAMAHTGAPAVRGAPRPPTAPAPPRKGTTLRSAQA